MSILEIEMTADDKDRWFNPLVEYYTKSKGMDTSSAVDKIEEVFNQAQAGWKHSPKDIDTRLKMKTGFQWSSQENLKLFKPNIPEIKVEETEEESSESFIYKHLSVEEKKWWDIRIYEYDRDFEFNKSSDKPLVIQLLFEELIQRRLFIKQLQSKKADFSKPLTEGLKRVTELQTKLGITREQRAGLLDNIDGNVADISVSLDKKLENMPKEMKMQYDEETRFQVLKNQRAPINLLPPKETMMAILNKDPGLGKVEVTNEAAQAITEIVSENKSEEKPKIVELPGGERLD